MPTTQGYRDQSIELDGKTIWRDVSRQIWAILGLTISISLLSFIVYMFLWKPVYMVETTYSVTTRGTNNDMFTNLNSAQYTAGQFTQIINSSALQRRVAEDIGGTVPMGALFAQNISETNLLVLRSTASTPESAFRTLKSAMEHYREITDFIIGNALMQVLIAPKVPLTHSNPFHPYLTMAIVFGITFFLLLALACISSALKDTVRKSSDVEKKLDTRLLGNICHEKQYRSFPLLSNKKKAIIISKPTTSFRYVESIHKIVRKVQNQMEKNKDKVLLVTSCLENEGKSTVAANVALALSRSGKKTILIDLDLRKPAQFRIFEEFTENYTDLGNVLSGKALAGSVIRKVPNEDLYIIFNSKDYVHSTELLTNGRMELILSYLKKEFDYVILDTPPMYEAADAEAIASLADASLCVVREHTALVRDINDMLDVLMSCKAKPVGCVFNDAYDSLGLNPGGYGYGYGYGHKYGYGYGYGRYGYGNNKR